MPVMTETSAAAIKERSALATRRFCEALQLGVVAPKNLTYLTIALTEAAAEEVARNGALRERIKQIYSGMLPPPRQTPPRPSAGVRADGARKGSTLAPGNPPDLGALARNYHPDEWATALRKYGMPALKNGVRVVQEEHPGAKPANMSTKEALVEFLLRYIRPIA